MAQMLQSIGAGFFRHPFSIHRIAVRTPDGMGICAAPM
jgi:hypothetical protein